MPIQPFSDPTQPGASQQVADFDPGGLPEALLSLPWAFQNPGATYLDYRCWVECALDAGMVLHKPLPQSNPSPDTLSSVVVGAADQDTNADGVNLGFNAMGADVIQRMATSTYTFTLKGWGHRAGYQIPVPGIVTAGGLPVTPAGRQWTSGNIVVGNWAGIPVFFCAWHLEYYVSGRPSPGGSLRAAPTPANLALRVRADAQLPRTVSLPTTHADQLATRQDLGRVGQARPLGRIR